MAPSRATRPSKPHVEASRSSMTQHARTESAREAPRSTKKRRKDRPTVYDSDDDPKDPVIATYDVFITSPSNAPDNVGSANDPKQASRPVTTRNNISSIHGSRQSSQNPHDTTTGVYLLQYPTRPRTSPYIHSAAPTALRVKPSAGFIELDVPTNLGECVDKSKAQDWARALERAESATGKGGTGYGLANGFVGEAGGGGGIYGGSHGGGVVGGGAVKTGTKNASKRVVNGHHNNNEGDAMDIDSEESTVLQTQTLGGLLTPGDGRGQPIYMIGAFKNDELHLTPLTAQAQLRPTHLHVDALHAQSQSHSHSLSQAPTQQSQHGTTARSAQQQQPIFRMATALPRSTSMSKNRNPDRTSSSSSMAQPRAHQQYRDRTTSGGGPGTSSGKYPRSARSLLASAASEHWSELRYVDEERDEAYAVFEGELFYDANKHDSDKNPSFDANNKHVKGEHQQQQQTRQELQSIWPSNRTGAEGWLGSIGDAPPTTVRRRTRSRSRRERRKEYVEVDGQQIPRTGTKTSTSTSTSTRKSTTNNDKNTNNGVINTTPITTTTPTPKFRATRDTNATATHANSRGQQPRREKSSRARTVSVASGDSPSPTSSSGAAAASGTKAEGARGNKLRGVAPTEPGGDGSQRQRGAHNDRDVEEEQQEVISISSGLSSFSSEEETTSDESESDEDSESSESDDIEMEGKA